MTDRKEKGSWLWSRCYACGHRLRFDSNGCPQCGEEFDGRKQPRKWPEKYRCELARVPVPKGAHGAAKEST